MEPPLRHPPIQYRDELLAVSSLAQVCELVDDYILKAFAGLLREF